MSDFRGYTNATGNGGGGGYTGGGASGAIGLGGAGYRLPASTAGEILGTTYATPVTSGQRLTVPNNPSLYYQNSAGQTDYPGLIVIVWNPI